MIIKKEYKIAAMCEEYDDCLEESRENEQKKH